MISGIVALIPLLLAQNPPAPPAPTPEAAALVARLQRPAPADTDYAEVRFVGLLKQPLVLHGRLHYGGPGELGKNVERPYRETMTIRDGTANVQRAGRPAQHFSLERAPELQALLAAFGALLGGDAATLAQYYTIDAHEDGGRFTLTLTPRGDLARHLRDIVVNGSGNEPACFTMRQVDGDASVMLFGRAADALPEKPSREALAAACRNAVQ